MCYFRVDSEVFSRALPSHLFLCSVGAEPISHTYRQHAIGTEVKEEEKGRTSNHRHISNFDHLKRVNMGFACLRAAAIFTTNRHSMLWGEIAPSPDSKEYSTSHKSTCRALLWQQCRRAPILSPDTNGGRRVSLLGVAGLSILLRLLLQQNRLCRTDTAQRRRMHGLGGTQRHAEQGYSSNGGMRRSVRQEGYKQC